MSMLLKPWTVATSFILNKYLIVKIKSAEPGETTVADVESQSNAVDVPEIPEGDIYLRII